MDQIVDRKRIEIDDALDAMPISRYQYWLVFLICLTLFLEGFDSQVMPLSVPDMARHWGLSPAQFGPALSAALVASMVSAVAIAPFADRHGRRPLLVASVFATGLGTLITALATAMPVVVCGRVLTGAGLGVSFPLAISILGDFMPRRRKALFVTMAINSLAVGSTAAGWLAPALVGMWGWKALFYTGGALPIVCSVLLVTALPESPKFLLLSGRKPSTAAHILKKIGFDGTAEVYCERQIAKKGGSVTSLFQGDMARVTLTLWAMFFLVLMALTMFQYWLPTLLRAADLPQAEAFQISGSMNAGALAGGLLLLFPAHRGRLLQGVGLAFAVAVVALLGLSLTTPQFLLWNVLVFLVGAGAGGAFIALTTVASASYPSAIQATGLGWALFIGRIAAIGVATGGGLLIASFAPAAVFGLLIIPIVLSAVTLAILARLRRSAGSTSPAVLAAAGH